MSLEEQKALESEYVMGTFARKPICLVEGKGMKVVDDQGRELLDFIAGIGVCSLGHCHPAVVQAVADQASKLIHVSNYYYIEKRGQVARMLSDLLNWGLEEGERFTWQSFFSNSGAESNECAMKLARLYARRFGNGGTDIVTLERSFHGRTMETLAATAQPAKQEAFQPVPGGFLHTAINDLDALKALFDDPANKICAVMVEPIQGESGVHPCTAEFLQGVQRLCREHGALVIADEVQTGIYRTGKPFGFQNFGIVPDIVSMAKGIASGFPTGACAAKKEVACAFEAGDHGTTFGGSNLAVAAAYATLSTLGEPGTLERIDAVGAYLRDRLRAIPGVENVRGFGLMVGCDVPQADANKVVLDALADGFLLNATGPHTLRFLPPLICTEAEASALADYLEGVLGA
ncbi:MAG: aspartate aminotransferase family protein [Coriobacteriaceae bacterium]|nr:aspartate aminotransferase family protein [Coriobacteriaceae bacterium]MDO4499351.1 aspartate aminotransferase family protein [Coriobacteriaceae bacterium]MDY3799592.1 aspartate aminotransferase family protein [Eggerthellaceae bacterium]